MGSLLAVMRIFEMNLRTLLLRKTQTLGPDLRTGVFFFFRQVLLATAIPGKQSER